MNNEMLQKIASDAYQDELDKLAAQFNLGETLNKAKSAVEKAVLSASKKSGEIYGSAKGGVKKGYEKSKDFAIKHKKELIIGGSGAAATGTGSMLAYSAGKRNK